MATLYLIDQNTVLRKSSERLILCKRPEKARRSPGVRIEDILLELPCEDVDQVMLFGNIQVTTQALQQLLEHGIELAIFTFTGRLLGQLTPPKAKNIHLRIAQFQRFHEPAFAFAFAKKVVDAKIRNALFIVRQHRKNHPEKLSDADLAKFDQLLARAAESTSLETLRGLEGAATAAYFQLFGRMLNPPWQFQTRTRRPPLDPVNAVLSFGYVIVGAELQSVLDGVGFDPYLGFYHAIEYGRPGLALDLLEEFRHSIVDRLALNLFNTHVVTNGDFFTPPRGGVYMNTSGKKKFFEHYEKMLGEYVGQLTIGPPAGDSRSSTGKRSFRAIFQQQVQALAKAVMGEKEYEPFQMK